MLGRRNLVVLGLGGHAERPKLLIQLVHEFGHPQADPPAVVVIQLLSLWGLRTEQGPSTDFEVEPLFIKPAVDQKIFLFGAHRRDDTF